MATLSEFIKYVAAEDELDLIQEIREEVLGNGAGTYCFECCRGEIQFGWMSESNDIDNIYYNDEEYFEGFTNFEDFKNGFVCGEEVVFVYINSVD